ncbi:hypothetical protein B0J13DRAFT_628917 [Dactylonectria estremocensis]|uniref:Zn(2)-C6 fungal-type domain-containing protein n=1 Tax=Dactylonectria estremocensis TaxID=1079267 RepID=A0A9P9DLM3_9HYPO|nr:hypothetical protein B0J13DRAFT_628917 [Dactylonectria estremocensis]
MADTKTARRQNHSCDQCRRSKKACDGYMLNCHSGGLTAAFPEHPYSDSGLRPCSYCIRTKKQCTLNSHWGKSRSQSDHSPSSSARGAAASQTKRQRTEHRAMSAASLPAPKGLDLSSSILQLLQTPSPSHHSFSWDAPIHGLEAHGGLPTGNSFGSLELDLGLASDEGESQTGSQDLAFDAPTTSTRHENDRLDSGFDSTVYSGSQESEFDFQAWGFSQACSEPRHPSFSTHETSNSSEGIRKNRRRRRASDDWPENSRASASPLDIDNGIVATSNNRLITQSLLQIYHDVLENNLSCWLSEDTCPYNMEQRRRGFHGMGAGYAGEFLARSANGRSGRGTNWPNRIYRRVLQLDRVAQSTKMIRLTRAENHAASRALDLVIMAFATQWAQGSRRREQYPQPSDTPGTAQDDPDDLANVLNEEFEQNLQQSIWEQAKKALQDVSELESYRVIYAELIFGLTQRPWASDDHDISIPPADTGRAQGIKESIVPKIMEIISQEGPPIYVERATRKIHALKFCLDANEAGFLETTPQPTNRQEAAVVRRMNSEERRTIGLLYWLAVMFDTVSSSMSERPVALQDEDCQHEAYSKPHAAAQPVMKSYLGAHRWNLDLFVQDNPAKPSLSLHWPCPPDVAANAVARSAPVKILLFRHLAYLQNALRKREYGQSIEDIIQSVTLLYRYWSMTHGGFFRELVKNYSSVPQRIRSWFFCIAVPWHLGSLMLADLIDFVDSNALGMEDSTLKRLDSGMTSRIRKASAMDLSDLARVTSPPRDSSGGMPEEQLPDFHFAVNEGPLLTEPWTIILIRAFTKAAVFHLSAADNLRQNEWAILGHDSDEFQDGLRRSEDCIRALWCLGKKSEMARNVTKVLSQALHTQRA